MTYRYCIAQNYGKNFITYDDSFKFHIKHILNNLYQISNNKEYADIWLNRVSGTLITLAEAQNIVDAEVSKILLEWESLSPELKEKTFKPNRIILE
jgi:hypothetical protein